ncbi:MAG: D-sedoheptulose-7-phosphate isomerase [Schwartzia sp. (in: firmicutes)]
MREASRQKIRDLIERYPALSVCQEEIERAAAALCQTFGARKKLLVCGNGGSAADAAHIVGELMKGFLKPRRLSAAQWERWRTVFPDTADYLHEHLQGALPAISLVDAAALNTAFANDQAPDLAMAQQVLGLGKAGDALLAISTSGNSANVCYAAQVARLEGLTTIALTGEGGGKLKDLADITIRVPARETFKIQEYHLPVYHALCIAAEEEFFGDEAASLHP